MCSALRIQSKRHYDVLSDIIWEVQNRIRHSGRAIGKRSIGSTLLVKGLEFDHAVIIHANNMSRKDWYVALTRATTSVTILRLNAFHQRHSDTENRWEGGNEQGLIRKPTSPALYTKPSVSTTHPFLLAAIVLEWEGNFLFGFLRSPLIVDIFC